MKKTIIKIAMALLLTAGSQFVYAQCGKSVILEASKTNFLDAEGKIQRTQEVPVDVIIKNGTVTILFGDKEAQTLTGKITESTCDWETPFKAGKLIIAANLKNPEGVLQTATLTIVAVNGQVTLTYVAKERPGVQIQLRADKFEELKG